MALSATETRRDSGELENQMESLLNEPGVSSGSSPESSVSIPAP